MATQTSAQCPFPCMSRHKQRTHTTWLWTGWLCYSVHLFHKESIVKLTLLFPLFCILALGAADGAVLLEGYVFDRATQRTIENVNIKWDADAVGATSDEQGRFVLRLPPGTHDLSFSRIGYRTARREVAVSDAKMPILYIAMTAWEIEMDTLDVVGKNAETRFEALREITEGDELKKKYGLTLAETIKSEMGVAIRSMGPASARPVIRGLSGDRVQINLDGIRTRDLSATSADHAVALELFGIHRLEIIRGPRTLLYSASAIGGVINAVKHKIPKVHPQRVSGSAGAYGETVNRGYLSAASITTPIGPLALYAETTYRDTRDMLTPVGKLDNTPIDTRTYTLGLSYPTHRGYIGASYDQFDTEYGIPGGFIGAHPNGADLDILRRVFDGKAAYTLDHAAINEVEASFTRTFYHHFEYESSGNIGSEFLFHNYNADLKLHFGPNRKTALALGFDHHDLKLGAYVFTPPTRKHSATIGLYREWTYRQLELQTAARYMYANFDPRPNIQTRVGTDVDRTFHTWSAAISPLVALSDGLHAGLSLSRSQRVPTIEELYNEGPHLAAYTYEVGNVDLDAETSLGVEVFFSYLQAGFDFVLSGYWNEFDTYIAPRNTGEINFAQLLPIYAADGIAARFLGAEMQVGWRPDARFNLELNSSYVRGQNRDDRLPLPEMPPLKLNAEVAYRFPFFALGVTAEFAAKQTRVDTYETPTDRYIVLGAFLQRDFQTAHTRHNAMLSVHNLFNREYRNHLSRIRSVMPEPGRNVRLNYKVYFF